jgi:hypothetical protein
MFSFFKVPISAVVVLIAMAVAAHALECPSMPEQTRKDWEVEVKTAIGKIGPARGADLEARTKAVTKDLMGKLPEANKVYLEQMMFAAYCSALRDDKNISETEKGNRIKAYNNEVRRTLQGQQGKPQASRDSEKARRQAPLAQNEEQGTRRDPKNSIYSGNDPERPDVHIVEADLEVRYDDDENLLIATGIPLIVRNLGKRTAINVEVRMWLGYDTKPDMVGPPVISYSISLLDPGPYNPALNKYTQYLTGASGRRMLFEEGKHAFPPQRVGEPPIPPTPPPFGRRTYLSGTVAFNDPLTERHYSQTVCFEQPFGWPEGRSSGAGGRIYAGMSRCK